jgi:hypothetical protein
LIFQVSVPWICGTGKAGETSFEFTRRHGFSYLDRLQDKVPTGMMFVLPKLPDLGLWAFILEHITDRVLTYDEDFERSLAGATDVMNVSFASGMIHGLPIFNFDIALLWIPCSTLVRRSGHPSWS